MEIMNMKDFAKSTGVKDDRVPEYRAIIKTDSKTEAVELIDKYRENTDINIIRFLGSLSKQHNLIYVGNNKDFDFIVGY